MVQCGAVWRAKTRRKPSERPACMRLRPSGPCAAFLSARDTHTKAFVPPSAVCHSFLRRQQGNVDSCESVAGVADGSFHAERQVIRDLDPRPVIVGNENGPQRICLATPRSPATPSDDRRVPRECRQ